jgi:NAD(P)-dependent dehydrogenase (short-subunit alcohol dehydrogenase family)
MMNGLQPRGIAGNPAEVAAAIVFLASDEAAHVIGHDMMVDGGATAGRVSGAPVSERDT